MCEIWKDIPDYEGLYQVSNLGQVKSLERTVLSKTNILKRVHERIKKPVIDEHGYCTVSLYKNNKEKILLVHRIVLAAFVGPCPEDMQVNHIDCNPSNNCLSNLEYVTPSQNIKYSYQYNRDSNIRSKDFYRKMGQNCYKEVECITDGNTFKSVKEASLFYNISMNVLYNRCKDSQCVNDLCFRYVEDNVSLGHKHLLENVSKSGSHRSKPVKCLETDQIFPSRIQAAFALNISTSSIVDSLRDGRSHRGYTFIEI